MEPAPEGATVICGTQYAVLTSGGTSAGCTDGGLEFTAYSVRTGRPVRVLYRYRGSCQLGFTQVLWAGASARYLIGALEFELPNPDGAKSQGGGKQVGLLGVISDGRLRPLRMAKALPASGYGSVAF